MSVDRLIPSTALTHAPSVVQGAQADVAKRLLQWSGTLPHLAEARAAREANQSADVSDLIRLDAEERTYIGVLDRYEAEGESALHNLHRTILDHQPELIETTATLVKEAKAKAGALVGELEQTLNELAELEAALTGYRRVDETKESVLRGKRFIQIGRPLFRRRTVGSARSIHARPAEIVAALRDIVDGFSAETETEGQRQAREARIREAVAQ